MIIILNIIKTYLKYNNIYKIKNKNDKILIKFY